MRRKKLWELDSRFHCPVIGTCLAVEELRRLARKAGVTVEVPMTDYELHHSFVQIVGNPVYATRLTHKHLDRKFATTLQRFGTGKGPAELESLWEEASTQGDVAAVFWALLTHPAAPETLMQRAYEEVHMLSHLAGHAHRAGQHELAALRRRVAEIEEIHAWTAEASRLRIRELEQRAEALAGRARRVDALERELAETRARVTRLESGETLAQLRAERDALAQDLERAARKTPSAICASGRRRCAFPSSSSTAPCPAFPVRIARRGATRLRPAIARVPICAGGACCTSADATGRSRTSARSWRATTANCCTTTAA